MCKVKVTKREGIGSCRYDPANYPEPSYAGRYEHNAYELEVNFPSSLHVQFRDDPQSVDIRRFGSEAEYNRYITDRLRHQMMDFVDKQIRDGIAAQAKNNRPKSEDDMTFLFKESK